jgi:hypothetical protein
MYILENKKEVSSTKNISRKYRNCDPEHLSNFTQKIAFEFVD